jgi:chromosomal replication initiator protein
MRQEVLRDEMDVVSALQQGLAASIGRERFDLWFGSTVQLERVGDMIVISAPDQFTLERIRRQFGRELHKTAAVVASGSLRLEFRVESREPLEEPQSPQPAESSTAISVPAANSVAVFKHQEAGLKSAMPPGVPDYNRAARKFARFESFVVGASNKIAATAAQSVAERLGSLSPLFLYGPSGTGKTHLLEAIWSFSRAGQRMTRSLFLSAEQFTSFFLEALQGAGLPSFRRKVRDVDLLLIDDIHFFAGKRATLVEFQHTLDSLLRQGRQLVVASDRSPAELTCLGPELANRLTGGLVCGLDLADFETRRGIARQLILRSGVKLPEDVSDLIALETNGDARQIQGALHRLRATSMALDQPITVELARGSLSDLFAAAKRLVRLPDIERAVCEVFDLEPKSLRDSGKGKAVSQPRMLAMWLARKYTRMAFSEISEFFGRRSHTTVISAENKVNRWVADKAKLQLGGHSWTADEAIRRLENKIRTG